MTARDALVWAASILVWGLTVSHVIYPITRAVIQGGRP